MTMAYLHLSIYFDFYFPLVIFSIQVLHIYIVISAPKYFMFFYYK